MAEPIKFEIGEPVTDADIPTYNTRGSSKYAALFATVDKLEPGQWPPVTVESERRGQRLVEVAKMRGYRRKRRGLVVYITKQEENDGRELSS